MLSGRGLCDKLITCPEESYRLCCVVVCDLETSRMGASYIYDISRLRVKIEMKYKLMVTCFLGCDLISYHIISYHIILFILIPITKAV